MKTGPFQLILSAAASLDPHIYGEHECECARVCVRAGVPACVPCTLGIWGCMCSQERLSLAAWNLESFPLSLSCCSDTPRVQQEAMTSVASLPDKSPGCRCRSLTGAGAPTSAAGPLARLLPRRRLPPPHLPARPRGWGVMKSKPLGRGRGGSGIGGRGTPSCPLCPGAPEYINSAVSSQTCTTSRTPPQCPPPRAPCHLVSGSLSLEGGGGGGGEAVSGSRRCFPSLSPFIDSVRVSGPLLGSESRSEWMDARARRPPVPEDVTPAGGGAPPVRGQAP